MSVAGRKYYLLLAVALITLPLAGFLIYTQLSKQKPDEPFDDYQFWQGLSNQTSAWLEQGNYKEIQRVENNVLEATPSPKAARHYAQFALNCAKSRRLGKYGDTYVMLAAGENSLAAEAKAPDAAPLVYELAYEFSLVNCYHRAFKLIDGIPESHRGEQALRLRQRLTQLFSALRVTTGEIPASTNDSAEEKLLSDQLIDLLGAPPDGLLETKLSSSVESPGTMHQDAESENPLIEPNPPKRDLTVPMIAGVFGTSRKRPPLPKGVHDEEYEDVEMDSGGEETGDAVPSLSRPIDLSPTEQQLALRLIAQGRPSGSSMMAAVKSSPLVRRLLTSGSEDDAEVPFAVSELSKVIPLNGALALVFSRDDASRIYLLAGRVIGSVRAYALDSAWGPGVQLKDVTGDHIPDLITRDRQGSGSFLYVAVIDPTINETIFDESDLPNGEVRFVDLDNDTATEILALYKTTLATYPCTQCPARYEITLFDYDAKTRGYKVAGRKLSYGEINILSGDNNIAGLGSHILATDLLAGGTQTGVARRILQTLRNQPTKKWSPEQLSELGGRLSWLDNVEESSMSQSTDKLELQTELVDTLNRSDLPPEWVNLRRSGQLWRIQTLFLMEEYEQALALTSEPWLMDGTESKAFRGDVYNTRGILLQHLGRINLAYDAYMRAIDELKDLPAATSEVHKVKGNLSYYFGSLGDFHRAYAFAREALDQSMLKASGDERTAAAGEDDDSESTEETAGAYRFNESQALDMNHLAEASFLLGKHSQALDWAGRALYVGRSSTLSAVSTMSLEVAAHIALLHNKPVLAIQLLDEAMFSVNESTWRTRGGGVLLLYARAAALQGDPQQAIGLLRASARLSKDVNTSVYVSAFFELSRLTRQSGSEAEALKYAREAFEGINRGRSELKLEDQKFSFLADKRAIASWFFGLLIEAQADPAELLHAVESWKMRTFIDLYDDARGQSPSPLTAPELYGQLSNILGDDDLLLNYVVTDNSRFVIAVSKSSGIKVYPLRASGEVIKEFKAKILRGFDIRDKVSLAAIRSDTVNAELDDALRKLYGETLQAIEIPNNVRRLIIAPDEILFGIPWAALKPHSGEYVADKYEVVMIPSSLLALRLSATAPPAGGWTLDGSARVLIACALGGVTGAELKADDSSLATQRPGIALAPLLNGWRECRGVADAFSTSNVEILADSETLKKTSKFEEGRRATPENLLARAPGARIIHVVGHGVFDPKSPMNSRLFLDDGRDGRVLKAADISSLNLNTVDLATLASCQTGLYGAMAGAEPLGFLRALLGAGAKSAVLTNWEVDDNTTSELISILYKRMQHERKSQALRQAQLQIRKRLQHPYFWAGHSLYGYWN
jgi:CHAT domain-containing protein/tetratricopeptide (TPR) repeat protein